MPKAKTTKTRKKVLTKKEIDAPVAAMESKEKIKIVATEKLRPESPVTVLAKQSKQCSIGGTRYNLFVDEFEVMMLVHAQYLERLGIVKIVQK